MCASALSFVAEHIDVRHANGPSRNIDWVLSVEYTCSGLAWINAECDSLLPDESALHGTNLTSSCSMAEVDMCTQLYTVARLYLRCSAAESKTGPDREDRALHFAIKRRVSSAVWHLKASIFSKIVALALCSSSYCHRPRRASILQDFTARCPSRAYGN